MNLPLPLPQKYIGFQRKKQKLLLDDGTSPVQPVPGAISIPQNPRSSNSSFGFTGPSPRSSSTAGVAFRLAPDEHGNEIPADAKWTKINRRLVSPEVLDQDHRRYEAYVYPTPIYPYPSLF